MVKETLDEAEMEAEEGRSRAIELDLLPEEFDDESPSQEEVQAGVTQQPKELLRGRVTVTRGADPLWHCGQMRPPSSSNAWDIVNR
ncbi:hypothetical protein QFC22_006522 [Naganishia vaughanmartiniae]|uniref:Uncharacterized protein n=1 Tax=Naganishia vaughanmartiniae TaxID=1424756 RepID=A0ACC2WJY7_9TREE|nr:hypothetical protein QFC22_006522 [Naganishia vaughanmartiniae]